MLSLVAGSPLWALSPEDVLAQLDSHESGLAESEARRRLAVHGPNELEEVAGPSVAWLLLHQFRSPLITILLVAAAVTLLLEEYLDAAVIAAVLVLNAVIGFTQEYKAERSMEALRDLARARARVVRDGREREIDARELVPGDVVLVETGAKVPADCRILHAVALEADESLLTGESTTVVKSAQPVPAESALGDRASMLFTGTIVTRGHCRALVVETGARTELGRIAERVQEIGERETPLQRQMARFAHVVGAAILASSALGLAVGVLLGEDPHDLFLAVVALAVAAIPEGLPIVLTLVLAISVRRMASRHAIIRRLPAVETLGSCTVIGSDKTGTLTQNRMTVTRVTAGGQGFEVTGGGYEVDGEVRSLEGESPSLEEGSPLWWTLVAGALCNEATAVPAGAEFDVAGDPTEIALLVAAAKAGLYRDELEERYVRIAEIPFVSEARMAATFHAFDGRTVALVKGAPEVVLELCVDAEGVALDRDAVRQEAERLAQEGLRVLALARRGLPDAEEARALAAEGVLDSLTFLGLQAMIDPPREEAVVAVRECQEAGIRVVMITGDHALTASAIAAALGIAPAWDVLTGVELDRLSDDELREAVTTTSVFARVSPEHKLRIVTALQENGETVAVTGDGVNDAPALRAADIGAAMGRSGTDVARESADMIVADDNFASIVAAVREGRVAFDNVRKTTFFLISSGAATIVAVLASIFVRFPLPLLPTQLLWLNLVTNGVQDVALAFEPGEKDVLRRPPRPRREGVISRVLWTRTAIAGAVMATGTLALFLQEWYRTDDLDRARTVALTTMVLFQAFHVGNCRSEHGSAFSKSPFSNRFLFLGTAAALAIQVVALHLPATQYLLRVEPLDPAIWVEMILVASSVVLAVELHKLIVRRRSGAPP
ncbi:MAG: ATPase [Gaiellaceae bacterium]|nr:MAG: ATPase [Gaiellaceae bacterium]